MCGTFKISTCSIVEMGDLSSLASSPAQGHCCWICRKVPSICYPWNIPFKNSSFKLSQWNSSRVMWSASDHVI